MRARRIRARPDGPEAISSAGVPTAAGRGLPCAVRSGAEGLAPHERHHPQQCAAGQSSKGPAAPGAGAAATRRARPAGQRAAPPAAARPARPLGDGTTRPRGAAGGGAPRLPGSRPVDGPGARLGRRGQRPRSRPLGPQREHRGARSGPRGRVGVRLARGRGEVVRRGRRRGPPKQPRERAHRGPPPPRADPPAAAPAWAGRPARPGRPPSGARAAPPGRPAWPRAPPPRAHRRRGAQRLPSGRRPGTRPPTVTAPNRLPGEPRQPSPLRTPFRRHERIRGLGRGRPTAAEIARVDISAGGDARRRIGQRALQGAIGVRARCSSCLRHGLRPPRVTDWDVNRRGATGGRACDRGPEGVADAPRRRCAAPRAGGGGGQRGGGRRGAGSRVARSPHSGEVP